MFHAWLFLRAIKSGVARRGQAAPPWPRARPRSRGRDLRLSSEALEVGTEWVASRPRPTSSRPRRLVISTLGILNKYLHLRRPSSGFPMRAPARSRLGKPAVHVCVECLTLRGACLRVRLGLGWRPPLRLGLVGECLRVVTASAYQHSTRQQRRTFHVN